MRSRVLWCVLAASPVVAEAALSYSYVDLGTFGGSSSQAYAINNSGHVVGWAASTGVGTVHDYDWQTRQWSVHTGAVQTRNAFVYDRGEMINLGVPGEQSEARAINDNNRIVGSVGWADNKKRAFRLKYGPMNETGNLNSFINPDVEGNWASAINNRNQAVVNSAYSGQNQFVYGNNTATNIGPLLGSPSWQRAINNSGLVVGESFPNANSTGAIHATSYDLSTGQVRDLGTLATKPTSTNPAGTPYFNESYAWDVNDGGQIVGSSSIDRTKAYEEQHAYVYQDGTMADLGMLPGTGSSTAFAINNHGTIVGSSGRFAFVYADGEMLDLNTLADVPDGWTITLARDVNDNGQIVGWATLDSSYGGTTHAFLLDPISQQSAGSMLSMNLESSSTYESVYLPDAGTFSASYVNVPLTEPVPEPTSLAVLGLAGGFLMRRKRRALGRGRNKI